ncbi:MAG: hypothetical protein ACOYM2_08535 [Rectinemataceae bacterium]
MQVITDMMKPIVRARRRPKLAAPSLDPLALGLIDLLGPLYSSITLRMQSMRFIHGERFVASVRDFYEGRARLVLAFRHPYGDEPQLLAWAMHRGLRAEARRLGAPLGVRPHCLFLHGYEVPLWSGPLVRWLIPRSGSLPVYHVRVDSSGIKATRRALRDGEHPLALAPEGQASYRSETLPRLERGALQLGFWCAEELAAAGRAEKVLILPLSVHVSHEARDLSALEACATALEVRLGPAGVAPAGVAPAGAAANAPQVSRSSDEGRRRALGLRLRAIDLRLQEAGESYYWPGQRPGGPTPPVETLLALADSNNTEFLALRAARHAALLEEALRRGEAMLGLASDGDAITRVYRIRHEGWNRIYPELDLAALPPHARALADRRAGEAWYAMRHMETVDLGWYLDAPYLEEGLADGGAPSLGRLAETLVNLDDFASRLEGGNITDRKNPLSRHICMVAAEPLEMTLRLPAYRSDRQTALAAAETDLASAFTGAIKEYLDGT